MKGLYIHIPFCKKKCIYCDFYSQEDISLIEDYLIAFTKEFHKKKNLYEKFFQAKKYTLYIGGGNPALLEIKDIEYILKKIYSAILNFEEITIEANPDSLSEEKIKSYRDLGINRLSIGIQSFDDEILKFLGRNHNSKDALRALEVVKKYFKNFSIDIIGGISGFYDGREIRRDLSKEFKIIEMFNPPHISFYLLSIEESPFFKDKFIIDETCQAKDYDIFCNFAKAKGYKHYEISNFAKRSFQCKHNKIYWRREEYLGFGPSAVSFLTSSADKQRWGLRLKNKSDIKEYIKDVEKTEVEILKRSDALSESIFLPLRTSQGIDLLKIEKHFPEEAQNIHKELFNLKKVGLLLEKKRRWIIREDSFIISNEIVSKILKGVF